MRDQMSTLRVSSKSKNENDDNVNNDNVDSVVDESRLLSPRQYSRLKEFREQHARRNATAEKQSSYTGIPTNVVKMDVVQWGITLGLIQSKDALEGKESKRSSLISVLLPKSSFNDQSRKTFNHYVAWRDAVLESECAQFKTNVVKAHCAAFNSYVLDEIKNEINRVERECGEKMYVNDSISDPIEAFATSCRQLVEICVDDNDYDVANVVRNAMFGFVDVKEYVNLGRVRFTALDDIFNRGVGSKTNFTNADDARLMRRLVISAWKRNFTRQPFSWKVISSFIRDPALIRIHASTVIKYAIVGYFLNGSVGYVVNDADRRNAFILHSVDKQTGTRLWILDYNLNSLSLNVRRKTFDYLYKTYATLRSSLSVDAFNELASTIKLSINWLANYERVRSFIFDVVRESNPIIPTELDVFRLDTQKVNVTNLNCPKLFIRQIDDPTKLF